MFYDGQDVLLFKSLEDFPKTLHLPFIQDSLKKIEDKIATLKIEKISANGAYKDFIENELEKFSQFKDFLTLKKKEIVGKKIEEAKKVGGTKKVEETEKVEETQETQESEKIEETQEKPKSRRKRRTSRKSQKSQKSEEGDNDAS